MIRTTLAAAMTAALISVGCAGSVSGSASISVSAEIDIPIAQMPTKYASWVVEAQGYLQAVNIAYQRHQQAKADLAAALGVRADADAIANFIRNAIKVRTTLVCTPPRFEASFVAKCTAQANARASGTAQNGQASGEASAGIRANCEARGRLSLSPGGCKLKTSTSTHPLLSDAARWGKAQAAMQVMLQLDAANNHLDGRGAAINKRGLVLHVQSVTDLAKDPTLVVQLQKIQTELKRGAAATGAANDKQFAMNGELDKMVGAINAQFPGISASVAVQ